MPRQSTLILVCGLPGAGKTTLAKRLEAELGAVRLCPDEWIFDILADPNGNIHERDRLRDPVERLLWRHGRRLLALGLDVILEYGFWGKDERTAYAAEARAAGARVELFVLEVPREELRRRILARNTADERGEFMMTSEEIETSWRLFQPVDETELATFDAGRIVAG